MPVMALHVTENPSMVTYHQELKLETGKFV